MLFLVVVFVVVEKEGYFFEMNLYVDIFDVYVFDVGELYGGKV